uniref:Uncharacterized protein n=1 Tax=Peronospora matthiolae TaxID=2874970 RepID=A0AAV1T5V3_9STRA
MGVMEALVRSFRMKEIEYGGDEGQGRLQRPKGIGEEERGREERKREKKEETKTKTHSRRSVGKQGICYLGGLEIRRDVSISVIV